MDYRTEIGDLRMETNRRRLRIEGLVTKVKGGVSGNRKRRRRKKNVSNVGNKGKPRGDIAETNIDVSEE